METSFFNYFFTSLLFLLTILNSSSTARVTRKTKTEFIETSCSTTRYPQLCYTSLSSYANAIQASHKLIALTALSLSLNSTKSTSAMIVCLSQGEKIMSPSVAAAMRDCVEVVSGSVDQLRNSLEEMNQLKGKSFDRTINNVQTWISAALTNDGTCMDGFVSKKTNGNVKNMVRNSVLNIAHMTSNALSLINSYKKKHG